MDKPRSIAETRKALSFATELRMLTNKYNPPVRVQAWVHKVANKIQIIYGTSKDYKKEMVIAWLKSEDAGGAVACQDVAEHFSWPRQTVNALLKDLVESGSIVEVKVESPSGRGRPAVRYWLTVERFPQPSRRK